MKKLYIVTGASRGLGAKFVEMLEINDQRYIGISRTLENKNDDQTTFPADIVNLTNDKVLQEKLFQRVAAETAEHIILINNAAVQGPIGSLLEVSFEEIDTTLQINLIAPMRLCQIFAHRFIKDKVLTIINIVGGGAATCQPFYNPYSVSKAGLARFTENIAREFADFENFQTFAVTPGFLKTSMHDNTLTIGKNRAREFYDFAKKMYDSGGEDPKKTVELCVALTDPKYRSLSGSFFSGAHDQLNDQMLKRLNDDRDLFKLRRIDDFNFSRI